MTSHRQRILMAARGELPDRLPYAPRIDVWYNAHSLAGTLPERHKGRTPDEIARAEGWALHKVIPDFAHARRMEDTLHYWSLGVPSLRETVFKYEFSPNVDVRVKSEGDTTLIEYHTPIGMVSTTTVYSDRMRAAGISSKWISQHILKKPEDYEVVGSIFDNIRLLPDFVDFIPWKQSIGEDGVAVAYVGGAGSPMHHIQKYLLDDTAFHYHYHDFPKEMRALSEKIAGLYAQALEIVADSPADAVLWGANFDEMITYPPFFEHEIMPWIRKNADTLQRKGKVLVCHCDGENLGLMDLIKESGLHVAEAVCPAPMTKVKIEDYYRRWGDKVTIFGGIPSNLLLAESTTDAEFEAYLDHLFQAVAPGKRLILGVADTTPPNAVFDRLVRIGERVEKEGRLPLQGGPIHSASAVQASAGATPVNLKVVEDEAFQVIQSDIFKGDQTKIVRDVQALLDKGVEAGDILDRGMLAAMEVISVKFKTGKLFIPEVLLSARAMNSALPALEPYLAKKERKASGKVLIGTVQGDMHNIGKNMVVIMLRGAGFQVQDLGVDVPTDEIVRQVAESKPDILALSALLTTTMLEMGKVIDALTKAGLRNSVKVIVGGAPVNEKFARDIGADSYARDCSEAVISVNKLMGN